MRMFGGLFLVALLAGCGPAEQPRKPETRSFSAQPNIKELQHERVLMRTAEAAVKRQIAATCGEEEAKRARIASDFRVTAIGESTWDVYGEATYTNNGKWVTAAYKVRLQDSGSLQVTEISLKP